MKSTLDKEPERFGKKPIWYEATIEVPEIYRRFKVRKNAEKFIEDVEARLKAINAICDNEIWTNIELIYLTRWDCPTARLAAAL